MHVQSFIPLYSYLSDQLERLQKRARRIISTKDLSYRQSLEVFNIPIFYDRREAIGNLMFQEISNNKNHKLYSLLPPPYLGMLWTRKNLKQRKQWRLTWSYPQAGWRTFRTLKKNISETFFTVFSRVIIWTQANVSLVGISIETGGIMEAGITGARILIG